MEQIKMMYWMVLYAVEGNPERAVAVLVAVTLVLALLVVLFWRVRRQ